MTAPTPVNAAARSTSAVRVLALAFALPLVPVFALAVAIPLLAAAGQHPFWSDGEITLSEAAALKGDATVIWAIRRGADPNAAARVRPGVLKSDEVFVTPGEAAVASNRSGMLRLLVAEGLRLDPVTRRSLLCFARRMQAKEAIAYLEEAPGAKAVSCDGVPLPW